MSITKMQKINPETNRPDRRLNQPTDRHLRREGDGLDILDDMIDGVYRINSEGYFTFMNEALVERWGIASEQYRKIHYLELIDPQYHEKARGNFQRVMGGAEGIPSELKLNGVNGQVRFVEVHSRPLHKGEKIVGLFGISRDITKRKLAEEALQKRRELYGKLISTIPDAIIQTDMSAKIVLINDVGVQLSGYSSAEEIKGQDLLSFIIPEDRKRANENLSLQLQRKIGPTSYSMITRDGRRITLEVNGEILRNTDAVPYGRVFICRDITDLKLAEEALKASEQKYRILMENASDAILLADTQGNIVEANRKAEELGGYTKEELLQLHYAQLHPMPDMERAMASFKEIIEKNTGHSSSGFIQRKDGDIVPVDITSNVIEYAGQKVIQGSFRDISEHKQTEDILEKLVEERTAELSRNNEQLKLEIKERKNAEAAMKRKSRELKHHTDRLSELNAALKVLLKQREDDKNDLEEKVTSNVKELLLPYIEKMKNGKIDPKGKVFLSILETNLHNIISPFTQRLSSKYLGLTPREVQVADLIRQGKSSKEIAGFIGISASAISIHRYHIREKLGLIEQKINLETHLQSLS